VSLTAILIKIIVTLSDEVQNLLLDIAKVVCHKYNIWLTLKSFVILDLLAVYDDTQ
jgi:hypothetical protein